MIETSWKDHDLRTGSQYETPGSSLVVLVVKNMFANTVPPLGREDSLGEGDGYPLLYSCLENPMDRGAWWASVHGARKSQTRLSMKYQNSK